MVGSMVISAIEKNKVGKGIANAEVHFLNFSLKYHTCKEK